MKTVFQIEEIKNTKEKLESFLKNLKDSNEIDKLKTEVIDSGFCPICFSELKIEITKERIFLFLTKQRKFTYCSKDKSHYIEEDCNGGLDEESMDK
jgi:hypothetical protein